MSTRLGDRHEAGRVGGVGRAWRWLAPLLLVVLAVGSAGCEETRAVPTPNVAATAEQAAAVVLTRAAQVATATPSPPAPSVRAATPTPATISGVVAPAGQPPPATAAPRLIWYRAEPFGPVRVEAGQAYTLTLSHLEQGTQVRAVLTVTFNNRLSNVTGTPDVDVQVLGPSGPLAAFPRARNGTSLAFQAPMDGTYRVVFDNRYSRVNAKQVSLVFIQP